MDPKTFTEGDLRAAAIRLLNQATIVDSKAPRVRRRQKEFVAVVKLTRFVLDGFGAELKIDGLGSPIVISTENSEPS